MELTAVSPAEIRLPERLDLAALLALRTEVLALGEAAVVVVCGAGSGAFCHGLALEDFTEVDPVSRDDGLNAFEAIA
ncbi:MAG: hypothetical protein L0271_27660, partial [Gemmatimonadetes bacterium]|nr:hypothetical protein [Gemmatimonadota bacterium]